jgi:hypothetical protein
MAVKMSEISLLGWRMPVYAASAAVLVFVPLLMSPNTDVLYLFVIVPCLFLTGICVLIYATIRKNLPIAVMVATFWTVSALLFVYNIQIRTFTRWFLWSGRYKNKVLAQPASVNGGLKHIEWDGWGWVVKTSRSFSFSIPRIRFQDRPKAVNRVSSMEYPARFPVFVEWTHIGILFFSTATSINLPGTAVNKPASCSQGIHHLRSR